MLVDPVAQPRQQLRVARRLSGPNVLPSEVAKERHPRKNIPRNAATDRVLAQAKFCGEAPKIDRRGALFGCSSLISDDKMTFDTHVRKGNQQVYSTYRKVTMKVVLGNRSVPESYEPIGLLSVNRVMSGSLVRVILRDMQRSGAFARLLSQYTADVLHAAADRRAMNAAGFFGAARAHAECDLDGRKNDAHMRDRIVLGKGAPESGEALFLSTIATLAVPLAGDDWVRRPRRLPGEGKCRR